MISTADFKTKTILKERKNPSAGDYWGVALDIGYSAVKGFSNNMVFCFPSYARKMVDKTMLGTPSTTDIMYRDDDTGDIWCVGQLAQNMVSTNETNDSESVLYGRNRYYSEMFKVIGRVGLGVGMISNQYGNPEGKTLVLQTGLPPAYMKSDKFMIQDVLSGEHNFSIKIGTKQWVTFSFNLPAENVAVMGQPMGTLLSISTDNDGNQIGEAFKYFKSNMLIFDPGFGTLDVFSIKNRAIEHNDTFDNLGMKRVLQETANKIFEQYHQEVSVPAMQKCLESGTVRCLDIKTRKRTNQPFADVLENVNREVCEEALSKIDTIYNYLLDYDYLVITGGTGAAWSEIIREHYKDMDSLKVVSGNQNDNLPCIFSNVRGYYMYLVGGLKNASKA